jgi:hypothetical protein
MESEVGGIDNDPSGIDEPVNVALIPERDSQLTAGLDRDETRGARKLALSRVLALG